jgi:hypothetical protein
MHNKPGKKTTIGYEYYWLLFSSRSAFFYNFGIEFQIYNLLQKWNWLMDDIKRAIGEETKLLAGQLREDMYNRAPTKRQKYAKQNGVWQQALCNF